MFSSGALDLALSKGLLDQPDHPRVEEFVAEVAARVHVAGTTWLFLDGPEQQFYVPRRRELKEEVLPSGCFVSVWDLEGDSEGESLICTHHCTNIGMYVQK